MELNPPKKLEIFDEKEFNSYWRKKANGKEYILRLKLIQGVNTDLLLNLFHKLVLLNDTQKASYLSRKRSLRMKTFPCLMGLIYRKTY